MKPDIWASFFIRIKIYSFNDRIVVNRKEKPYEYIKINMDNN